MDGLAESDDPDAVVAEIAALTAQVAAEGLVVRGMAVYANPASCQQLLSHPLVSAVVPLDQSSQSCSSSGGGGNTGQVPAKPTAWAVS